MNNTSANCCACFDFREPSYNNIFSLYPNARRGFMPAGGYAFNKEGAIFDSCQGRVLNGDEIFAITGGPFVGVTMGACTPRAVQLSLLDKAGAYTQGSVFGAPNYSRGCFL